MHAVAVPTAGITSSGGHNEPPRMVESQCGTGRQRRTDIIGSSAAVNMTLITGEPYG
jgi:hypothetical protein